MSILVVDDESEARALLMAILNAEGYEVRAADGGELALASVALERPELILLDLRMPGMDGFQVCWKLKKSAATRDIPVMFITGSGDLEARVEGLQLGAVDYVIKPFQREELLARVNTHLELARLRHNLEQQVARRTAELQESEERFRTMANAAPVMIWVSSPDKQRTFFNRRWLEFTGRNLGEELGKGWVAGVYPDDSELCYQAHSSSLEAWQDPQIEYRLRRADGVYRWVLDTEVPRFAADGTFQGYIGSGIDITDLKQNQDRMLAAQKLESLGVMAAGVAHDFNNLLSTILLEADLALSEMNPGTPGRGSLERINAVGEGAAEIVKLLLASAGPGLGHDSAEAVDVSVLVEQTLRLLPGSVSRKAMIRTSLAKDLSAVRGNVAEIRQVIMNLLINASEALGENQGVVTVTTERAHFGPKSSAAGAANVAEGEYVRLTISDTGCGMTPETRAKIFDQFFTTKSLGRGLGLAVVHGIVRSHGGAISVASTPGAGTTFEVLLPCGAKAGKRLSASCPNR
jgi:PAS domain S-box-containing protein